MECPEAREHLSDLNRGRLGADLAEAVRIHVSQCPACTAALHLDAQIRALIQDRVPRHTAPPGLRARIRAMLVQAAPAGWAAWSTWLRGHRWAVASLVGAVVVVLLVWAGLFWIVRDPVSRLEARAVAEHVEYAREAMNRPAADPQELLNRLQSEMDFAFQPVFRGDSEVRLVTGAVSDLPGKRAATFVYRDAAGRYTTLFLMPGTGIVVPEGDRMLIETFRPHYRTASGRSLLLWKHRDLAWLLVSDLDKSEVPAMYLKVRKAANPPSASRPSGIS
jgi:anti-sigma factor (TIGR02949 family)